MIQFKGQALSWELKDGVIELALHRDPCNEIGSLTLEELEKFVSALERMQDNAHTLILYSTLKSGFCAGADLRELYHGAQGMEKQAATRGVREFLQRIHKVMNTIDAAPLTTIAALNGHTVGGGLEIAMACDIRLAKENAGKIGLPEVNLGVLPGTGGTQRLARLVGKARAIELMVKGELFSFDRAKELGIVNEIFPAKEFWEQVMLYAKQFCPPHKASKAVGLIKRSVQTGAEIPFESALALERELQQQLFQSEDAKEGIAANVEKRVGEFKGR